MGIKIVEVIVLRVIITVERGKSMFQLHAVLSTQLAPARGNVRNTSANLQKLQKKVKKMRSSSIHYACWLLERMRI